MAVLACISDIHLSDRPPSSCTESYLDDLFDLLEQAREVTKRRATAMVWAGDVFHCKAPSRVSHRLVHRACEFIDSCPFPVLIVPGNHDIANDRVDSVWESQPLGMLYRAGAHELIGWRSPFKVYGVPWLQGYGDDPTDMHGAVSDALAAYRDAKIGSREPYLVATHAPLYPPGRELSYEYYPADGWADAMRNGQVFYGHVHEPHGIYRAGGVTFCNNGALSRGSLHEYNLTRQVGVTLWDDSTGEFEFVPLDAKPASEVFRLQEKQQATDVQGRLDEFLASAGAATLEVLSIESVVAHVRTLGLGRDVEDLVEELLQEARHA